ncbi:MAG TPA: hypothetical protein PKY81_10820 [bacterium]|nr:hypothetical protein [bacterium]
MNNLFLDKDYLKKQAAKRAAQIIKKYNRDKAALNIPSIKKSILHFKKIVSKYEKKYNILSETIIKKEPLYFDNPEEIENWVDSYRGLLNMQRELIVKQEKMANE